MLAHHSGFVVCPFLAPFSCVSFSPRGASRVVVVELMPQEGIVDMYSVFPVLEKLGGPPYNLVAVPPSRSECSWMWSPFFPPHLTLTLWHPTWFAHFHNGHACPYPAFFGDCQSQESGPGRVDSSRQISLAEVCVLLKSLCRTLPHQDESIRRRGLWEVIKAGGGQRD